MPGGGDEVARRWARLRSEGYARALFKRRPRWYNAAPQQYRLRYGCEEPRWRTQKPAQNIVIGRSLTLLSRFQYVYILGRSGSRQQYFSLPGLIKVATAASSTDRQYQCAGDHGIGV